MFDCDVRNSLKTIKVADHKTPEKEDGAMVKIILLDNGKPVFVVANGLVDTAITELGARVVDVTE